MHFIRVRYSKKTTESAEKIEWLYWVHVDELVAHNVQKGITTSGNNLACALKHVRDILSFSRCVHAFASVVDASSFETLTYVTSFGSSISILHLALKLAKQIRST